MVAPWSRWPPAFSPLLLILLLNSRPDLAILNPCAAPTLTSMRRSSFHHDSCLTISAHSSTIVHYHHRWESDVWYVVHPPAVTHTCSIQDPPGASNSSIQQGVAESFTLLQLKHLCSSYPSPTFMTPPGSNDPRIAPSGTQKDPTTQGILMGDSGI